jgi:hypothetical protein
MAEEENGMEEEIENAEDYVSTVPQTTISCLDVKHTMQYIVAAHVLYTQFLDESLPAELHPV